MGMEKHKMTDTEQFMRIHRKGTLVGVYILGDKSSITCVQIYEFDKQYFAFAIPGLSGNLADSIELNELFGNAPEIKMYPLIEKMYLMESHKEAIELQVGAEVI